MRGEQLRDVRKAAGIGLREMARRTFYSSSYLSMIEREERELQPDVLDAYERVLGLELRGDDTVRRRDFLWLLGVAGANATVATELAASIAGNDPGPLATVQTSHGIDHALAALTDRATVRVLHRWAADEPDPVLRVNATGILAKLPDQTEAEAVAQLLERDHDVQFRYSTAVIARVCGMNWETAANIAHGDDVFRKPRRAAEILIRELLNPRDVGARWCSAAVLQTLAPRLGGTT